MVSDSHSSPQAAGGFFGDKCLSPRRGYIYLFFLPSEGVYKTGMSKKPWARFGGLVRMYPGLRYLAHFPTADADYAAREWYRRATGYRAAGQWFRLPPRLVAEFFAAARANGGFADPAYQPAQEAVGEGDGAGRVS